MQNAYGQFKARGVEIVAVAVNTIQAIASAQEAVHASFPMLADPNHEAAAAYGVHDLLGDGLAAPAVFVIDRDGSILWSYIGQEAHDRPAVDEILANLP